jgi:hypothetical protein
MSGFAGVHQPHEYYLIYFGVNQPSEIEANVQAGEQYKAELVDTWEMTVTLSLNNHGVRLRCETNQGRSRAIRTIHIRRIETFGRFPFT